MNWNEIKSNQLKRLEELGKDVGNKHCLVPIGVELEENDQILGSTTNLSNMKTNLEWIFVSKFKGWVGSIHNNPDNIIIRYKLTEGGLIVRKCTNKDV